MNKTFNACKFFGNNINQTDSKNLFIYIFIYTYLMNLNHYKIRENINMYLVSIVYQIKKLKI